MDQVSVSAEDEQKLVTVQAGIRGYLTRKHLAAKKKTGRGAQCLPDLSKVSTEDEAKLVKLQASVRGHLARKKMKSVKIRDAE
jgi:hypothetical protein